MIIMRGGVFFTVLFCWMFFFFSGLWVCICVRFFFILGIMIRISLDISETIREGALCLIFFYYY